MMYDVRQKDPDARFIAMMRDFVAACSAKNASTEDFRRVVEKHMGEPMDWFFNQWVYGTEVPSYSIRYQTKDAGNGKTLLTFSVTESGVSPQFQGRVPIYAIVKGQPNRLGLARIVGPATASAEVQLPFNPEKVTLDEGHSILCHSRE
jgi:aminopeptidase N